MAPKEYRGRLSTGCEPCRGRRVKCNEGRPICANCVKSGLGDQCRYRNLIEMSFRNESSQIAQKARKTWKARTKDTPGNQSFAPLHTALSVDVTDCAINRFFYDYTMPNGWPVRPFMGVFDYIPQVFAEAPPNSSLKEALCAVSLANYDRRTGFSIGGSRLKIERHYGNALRMVAKETQDPAIVTSDQLLLAVQMLSMFEQMSSGGNNPVFLQAHAHGLAALVNVRKMPNFEDSYRWRMFQSINAQMLTACLQLRIPPLIEYSRFKFCYESAPYPMIRMMGLVHKGVNLMALWNEALASTEPADQMNQANLRSQMIALDKAFDIWETTVFETSRFTLHPTPAAAAQPKWLRPILDHPGTPQISHKYDTVQITHSWNMARVMRTVIAKALFKASFSTPGTDLRPYKETIQRMVVDTCRSILSIFTTPIDGKPQAETLEEVCGFRAYMAMFPLHVARGASSLLTDNVESRNTMAWIDLVLSFITKQFHRLPPR